MSGFQSYAPGTKLAVPSWVLSVVTATLMGCGPNDGVREPARSWEVGADEVETLQDALDASAINSVTFLKDNKVTYVGAKDFRIKSAGNGKCATKSSTSQGISLTTCSTTSGNQKFSIFEHAVPFTSAFPEVPRTSYSICQRGTLATASVTICLNRDPITKQCAFTYKAPGYTANCVYGIPALEPATDFAFTKQIIAVKHPGESAYSATFAAFVSFPNADRPGTVFIKEVPKTVTENPVNDPFLVWDQVANDIKPASGVGPSPDNSLSESWFVE